MSRTAETKFVSNSVREKWKTHFVFHWTPEGPCFGSKDHISGIVNIKSKKERDSSLTKPKTKSLYMLESLYESITKIDCMLGYKTSPNKSQKTEIIHSVTTIE